MALRQTLVLVLSLTVWSSCTTNPTIKEEYKIFHAGPVDSGLSGIYFGLYQGNKYQFCDGDFMDWGCYTGFYSISGDTITLKDLKQREGIPTNRFIIRRYSKMDSSYWQWKYPEHQNEWRRMQEADSSMSAIGDVFPLDSAGKIIMNKNHYFLIRLDEL